MPEPEAKKFQVIVNGRSFYFSEDDLAKADIVHRNHHSYHIIRDHESIEVHCRDVMGKQLQLEADGEKYALTIKTGLDQMLDTMGFNNVSTRQAKDIKAPMPGLVLDISVKEGDEVQEGQRVLILEAMKMENSIVMHSHGVIRKVLVHKGQAVDKNQVLVELE